MGWGVRWRVKMRRVIENLSSFRIGLVLTLFMITFLNLWHHFVYYLSFFLYLVLCTLYSLFFKCFAQNIYDMILQKHDTCFEFVFFPSGAACLFMNCKTSCAEQEIHVVSNYQSKQNVSRQFNE